jgi:hypothetical protein
LTPKFGKERLKIFIDLKSWDVTIMDLNALNLFHLEISTISPLIALSRKQNYVLDHNTGQENLSF